MPRTILSIGRLARQSVEFEHERRFKLFGSRVRLLIGEPSCKALPSPDAMGIQIEFFLRLLHRKLTRFDPSSELPVLNADPRVHVLVGSTLATAIGAALWAAQRSNGLVDPTLLRELEEAGYADSRADVAPAPIRDALEVAPERRAAHPWTAPR